MTKAKVYRWKQDAVSVGRVSFTDVDSDAWLWLDEAPLVQWHFKKLSQDGSILADRSLTLRQPLRDAEDEARSVISEASVSAVRQYEHVDPERVRMLKEEIEDVRPDFPGPW